MTITATCQFLAEPQPPSWRWQPQPTVTVDQPALPLASADDPALAGPTVPGEVVQRFAHLVVEALQGRRRPEQLQGFFDPGALRALGTRASVLRSQGIRLASVRAQSPRPGVAEVTLRLSSVRSNTAVALRLTDQGNAWRCTALAIG